MPADRAIPNYTLTLGLGAEANQYEFVRIGTASEKDSVAQEIAELKSKLAQVDTWTQRRKDIDAELNKVWVSGGGDAGAKEGEKTEKVELAAPEYQQEEKK